MNVGGHLVKLEVFNPLSEVTIKAENAARLDTLQGKTICEMWHTGDWGADRTFPVIRGLLQKQFPKVKIVPYTELPIGQYHRDQHAVPLDKVGEVLRGKGCDALLLGNGG